jgi:hypothetical protein
MNGIGGDKTRFADGSAAMMQNDECRCPCICDGPTARIMDQTGARFNERAAYANTNQMDNQTLLLSMFQAQAQNALEQTPATDLVNLVAQMIALSQAPQ